jgi:predicted Zn-dependent protease
MRKAYWLIVFTFLISLNCIAQTQEKEYWNALLKNDRKKALKEFKKATSNNDIETHITQQILNVENGILSGDDTFISKVINDKDFEMYLYGLWNETYFFNLYIDTGFNPTIVKNVKDISKIEFKNQTLKDAMNYMNAIISRHENNWDEYHENIAKMDFINDWQYCGVFENLNESGLDEVYGPEMNASSKEDFNANSNGFVNWYTPKFQGSGGYNFYTNHDEYGNGVNYAQTFVTSKEAKKVVLRVGNSSAFKVWLNDEILYTNTEDVTTDLDAYAVAFTLPKGTSRLLIKNAEGNSISYFIARLTDENGTPIKDVTYSSKVQEYTKGTKTNPVKVESAVERFFKAKRAANPNNFFYDYCLVRMYLRNSNYKEARKIIAPHLKAYPKSSLLRKMNIGILSLEKDYTTIKEINKNLELDDPDYYLSLTYKFRDTDELFRMDINEMEKFIKRFSEATDVKVFKISSEVLWQIRNSDQKGLEQSMKKLVKAADGYPKLLNTYAPLYASILKDEEKTIDILEDLTKRYFNYSAISSLAYYYEKQNKKDKAIKLYKEIYENSKGDNFSIKDIIEKLHKYDRHEESLPYIKELKENFPYSFVADRYEGDVYIKLGEKDKAVAAYKASLLHNMENSSLRKKIQDIQNQKDFLEELHEPKIYDYIAKERGKLKESRYGYTILLDDKDVVLFKEGGGKTRFTSMYEITAEEGVSSFKEYNLGLSGSYSIIKSEIVKKDGSVAPADSQGSNLVFNGLEIGDVIHLDYEINFSGNGRFYKDYTDSFQFDSFVPCLKSNYSILIPKEQEMLFKVVNGELKHRKEAKGDYTLYTWELFTEKVLPEQEYYMPREVDLALFLHISTIGSWDDIAKWYSDLVRTQIDVNTTVEEVFKELFPEKDVTKISEEERAKRIYYYITTNLNYSYVSFRQSGYIPQKPSKTIKTKLGDCKDFSTLFVALAKKAKLDTNLVLILTSDYGQNALVLPSQDFNHCIAEVTLNGESQFLELTDKNLPFKALPVSLQGATALKIPYDASTNKKYDLMKLKNVKRTPSVFRNNVKVTIEADKQTLESVTSLEGEVVSFYSGTLTNRSYDLMKNDLQDDLKGRIGGNITIDTITDITAKKESEVFKFRTVATLEEKAKKIGSISVVQIPNISNAYNNSIINFETRSYPIEYIQYENVDQYITEYQLYIPEGKKFIEYPKNIVLTYKGHSYKMSYELKNDNRLDVKVEANVDKGNLILPEEYEAFKKYVAQTIEGKEGFIGYK